MKKIFIILLSIVCMFTLLVGCSTPSDETLLKTPFIMEVYKTYLNGAHVDTYPNKVFNSDELFNALNSATGEQPFEVEQVGIEYIVKMVNGNDYSTFNIWNDGSVTLNFNILFDSEFYLTSKEYQEIVSIIED